MEQQPVPETPKFEFFVDGDRLFPATIWFAWRPVRLRHGGWAWLRTVQRRTGGWLLLPGMRGFIRLYDYQPMPKDRSDLVPMVPGARLYVPRRKRTKEEIDADDELARQHRPWWYGSD